MATDDDLPPAVKLAAIKDALDRAGLGAKQALEVTHQIPRYMKLFEDLDRESIGAPAPAIIEGQIIDTDSYVDFGDGRTP